jgi:hypothetical protein
LKHFSSVSLALAHDRTVLRGLAAAPDVTFVRGGAKAHGHDSVFFPTSFRD